MSHKQTNLKHCWLSMSSRRKKNPCLSLVVFSPWCLLLVLHVASTNLFLELGQLPRQVGHQFHGALQFLLQVSDFILLPVCITADQGHGPHPREPVQVVLLVNRNHETVGSHSFVGACCCGFSSYPKRLLLVLQLFLQINWSNFCHSRQLQIIHTFSPQMEWSMNARPCLICFDCVLCDLKSDLETKSN